MYLLWAQEARPLHSTCMLPVPLIAIVPATHDAEPGIPREHVTHTTIIFHFSAQIVDRILGKDSDTERESVL